MAVPSHAEVLSLWVPGARAPAQQRLATLLAAAGDVDVDAVTLGQRQQQLLALHRALVGGPIEAQVSCSACATTNEFNVPADAIAAAPSSPAGATVEIVEGESSWRFRVPVMRDLAPMAEPMAATILDRCRVAGPLEVPASVAAAAGAAFEAIDPAANIVVTIACAGCGTGIAATVDIADFVARDLDLLADSLMRDIDVLAGAYGWDEATILALPAARRRRYIELVANRRSPPRAVAGSFG